jgi:hypothetical protein
VLPEGVTPTTDRINILRHGPEPAERCWRRTCWSAPTPRALLREISIVDTPGTNAVIRRHEELTRDFMPRSDLILFVTSADRPFTESERGFLEQIREWGKKVIMVINKIDILADPADREQVIGFVREHARHAAGPGAGDLRGLRAPGDAARKAGDEGLWDASGFERDGGYLLHTLDQEERIRLKLLNPLRVGLRLASVYKDIAFERLKLLSEDVQTHREHRPPARRSSTRRCCATWSRACRGCE